MNTHKDYLGKSLLILTLATVGATALYAWTGPTQAPPLGNISAPINTSLDPQVKEGDLTVNNLKLGSGGGIFANGTAAESGSFAVVSNIPQRAGINFKNSSDTNLGSLYAYSNGIFIKNSLGWIFGAYNTGDTQSFRDNYVLRDSFVLGTTTTNGLRVINGAADGKVLMSDVDGNAGWQSPSGGGLVKYGGSYLINTGSCWTGNLITGGCSCPTGYITHHSSYATFPGQFWEGPKIVDGYSCEAL